MEKEEIKTINESINIVDYARSRLGFSLVKVGRCITAKEHDSLRIYPETNSFCRFSTGKGGFVIQLIQEFDPLAENNFEKALEIATAYVNEHQLLPKFKIDMQKQQPKKSRKEYLDYLLNESEYKNKFPKLPAKNNNNQAVIRYLNQERKIDIEIIQKWIDKGLIYEDIMSNMVFVGKDFKDDVKYGHVRSLDKKYFYDVEYSAKIVGISYHNENAKRLYITESVIDAMSVMQMTCDFNASYLSIQGTTNVESTLFYLMVHGTHQLKQVYLCLDRDSKGIEATKKIIDRLEHLNRFQDLNTEHFETKIIIPEHKDFNEDLVQQQTNMKDLEIEL